MAGKNISDVKTSNSKKNEYLELCRQDRCLEAVKLYMEDTGCSLREAKEYIDTLRNDNGIQMPQSGRGCMVALMFLVVLTSSLILL